jgi:hypothetical protein
MDAEQTDYPNAREVTKDELWQWVAAHTAVPEHFLSMRMVQLRDGRMRRLLLTNDKDDKGRVLAYEDHDAHDEAKHAYYLVAA